MRINNAMTSSGNSFFRHTNLDTNYNKDQNKKSILKNNNNLVQGEKSLLEILQEQRNKILERKEKIRGNDNISIEEKKDMLSIIDDNIKDIDKQIQQAKIMEKQRELEEAKEKAEEKAEKEAEERERLNGDTVKDGVIIAKSLTKLIEAKSSIDNVHQFNGSKARLENELSYLDMKSVPKETWSFNGKHAAKLKGAMAGLEGAANNQVKKAMDSTKDSKEIREKETNTDTNQEEE